MGPGGGNPTLHVNLRTDQANTEPWKNRWANVADVLRESFVPSLPRLTAVEVELLAVHPGPPATGDIDMMILNPKKMMVAALSKTVAADDCSHVLFLPPRGGLQVSPGQVYTIQLREFGGVFGWKYIVGGYREGAASAEGWNADPNAPSPVVQVQGQDMVLKFLVNPFQFPEFEKNEIGVGHSTIVRRFARVMSWPAVGIRKGALLNGSCRW